MVSIARCAVMGNPIAHSLSPVIHAYFAKQTAIPLQYTKIKVEGQDFESQVRSFFNTGGLGLNITAPFKQRAFVLAHQRTERCAKAGSANTLWYKNNQLWADNTDGIGLVRDLKRYLPLTEKRILILGAGGAAQGLIQPLLEEGLSELTVVGRSVEKMKLISQRFKNIQCIISPKYRMKSYDLMIHATSAPDVPTFLANLNFAEKPFCYDLSYAIDHVTPFVRHATALGCEAVDGLGMLVEQAAESFFMWHGVKPNVLEVLTSFRAQQENS